MLSTRSPTPECRVTVTYYVRAAEGRCFFACAYDVGWCDPLPLAPRPSSRPRTIEGREGPRLRRSVGACLAAGTMARLQREGRESAVGKCARAAMGP